MKNVIMEIDNSTMSSIMKANTLMTCIVRRAMNFDRHYKYLVVDLDDSARGEVAYRCAQMASFYVPSLKIYTSWGKYSYWEKQQGAIKRMPKIFIKWKLKNKKTLHWTLEDTMGKGLGPILKDISESRARSIINNLYREKENNADSDNACL